MQLLAVNGANYAGGMATMAALGNLPILQDTAAVDAWGLWAVTYRDVVILDADNNFVGVYNLSSNDLNDTTNYDALRDLLIAEIAP